MGLFSKPAPAAPVVDIHDTDEGKVVTSPGVAPHAKQAAPGGPMTRYRLLGRNDPEHGFIKPPGFRIVFARGEIRIGDEVELTQLEHQVFSKNAVLVPVDAL